MLRVSSWCNPLVSLEAFHLFFFVSFPLYSRYLTHHKFLHFPVDLFFLLNASCIWSNSSSSSVSVSRVCFFHLQLFGLFVGACPGIQAYANGAAVVDTGVLLSAHACAHHVITKQRQPVIRVPWAFILDTNQSMLSLTLPIMEKMLSQRTNLNNKNVC